MDFQRGLVVCNNAGRDKGRFFTVIHYDKVCAEICDGKYRKLAQPKRKNIKHLSVTNTVLKEEQLRTDKQIRLALKPFND